MTPKQIRERFRRDTQPILARLGELRDDDIRARDGRGRNIPPAEADQERQALLRRYTAAEQAAQRAMDEFLAESASRVQAARAIPGDAQERLANLTEADHLARQGLDAGDLAGRARDALARGDTRAAMVHLDAARLKASGQRVGGLQQIAQAVEAALDQSIPARREAIEAHRADRFEYADELIERTKTRQLVAVLTEDRGAAARASASAKLRQYDLARAKGETYEQEVNLERVGAEPRVTVSGG